MFSDPFGIPPAEVNETKFFLYVKKRQAQEIRHQMVQLMLFSPHDKKRWIEKNHHLVQTWIDDFMDDSLLIMDGQPLDKESMDLTLQLMNDIRDSMVVLQNILDEKKVRKNKKHVLN